MAEKPKTAEQIFTDRTWEWLAKLLDNNKDGQIDRIDIATNRPALLQNQRKEADDLLVQLDKMRIQKGIPDARPYTKHDIAALSNHVCADANEVAEVLHNYLNAYSEQRLEGRMTMQDAYASLDKVKAKINSVDTNRNGEFSYGELMENNGRSLRLAAIPPHITPPSISSNDKKDWNLKLRTN